jgi:hypothetical protein
MPIIFFVATRILFAACMVFIIGYIFGGFSKNPIFTRFAKIASILVIVLFLLTGVFFFRLGGLRHYGNNNGYWCRCYQRDSVIHK